MPAEWVTVRRIRVKDAVEYVWWLSKTPNPKANNRGVLKRYSKDMERLNQRGVRRTTRPSGHNIKPGFGDVTPGGSIPPNMLEERLPTDLLKFGNNAANDVYTERCKQSSSKIHPARFPAASPSSFSSYLPTRETSSWIRSLDRIRRVPSRRDWGDGGLQLRRSKATWQPANIDLINRTWCQDAVTPRRTGRQSFCTSGNIFSASTSHLTDVRFLPARLVDSRLALLPLVHSFHLPDQWGPTSSRF